MAFPFDLRAAVRSEGGVSRRLFLAAGAALAGLPRLAATATAADRQVKFSADPFTLGVASGDPDASSVILWTRLAPKPLDPDGGLKPGAVPATWEVADDEAMTKVVASGTATATPQLGHSVHAEAKGLRPDRWYFYRFRAGDAVSPVGRTRTLPAADADPDKLRFAFASCQHYEQGLFTAYEHMAKDDLDLVFHLGDYIYEYPHRKTKDDGTPAAKTVRTHAGPSGGKIKTLDDYRNRHAQYRADPLLHRMHARCPWFVTWDDHEFDNNYADDVQEEQPGGRTKADPALFLEQRAAAYQAYYEFMPLRPASLPRGPDLRLYRKASFGRLAELLVLDTRQYRTDQPNGDRLSPLDVDALNPKNTILGREQRGWLEASLLTSPATWNVLAQQVMMGMVEVSYGGQKGYSMDQWPGYARERMALVDFLRTRRVPNPVVLTGDIHSNWVNDLRVDDRKAEAPVVATEFVGTSITTGGNGQKEAKGVDALLAANPGVRFHNRERGYVRCTVTPGAWTTDYVVVEDVTTPGAPAVTRASFAVEAGKPGAAKA